MTTKEKPTPAEAFARLRAYLEITGAPDTVWDSSEELALLTLLQRLMGLQERAIREALRDIEADEGDPWATLHAALTDTPPVFSLEEIEVVMLARGHSRQDIQLVTDWLSKLRSRN